MCSELGVTSSQEMRVHFIVAASFLAGGGWRGKCSHPGKLQATNTRSSVCTVSSRVNASNSRTPLGKTAATPSLQDRILRSCSLQGRKEGLGGHFKLPLIVPVTHELAVVFQLILSTILQGRHHLSLTPRETDSERWSYLSKGTQPVSGGTWI